jgi:excisionase family DNA binding protein
MIGKKMTPSKTSLQKLDEKISALLEQGSKPLSLKEACVYLNVTKSHLYKLTYQNLITHFKPNGKKIYFKKSDLDKYIFRNQKSYKSEFSEQALKGN